MWRQMRVAEVLGVAWGAAVKTRQGTVQERQRAGESFAWQIELWLRRRVRKYAA